MDPRDRWWVIGKYSLFQLPGIVLVALVAWWARGRFGITDEIALIAVIAWIVKDVLMFPLVRTAYTPNRHTEAMLGTLVTAEEPISSTGYVRAGAELWHAELMPKAQPLPSGARARVRQVRGLTLVVDPVRVDHDD